MPGDPPYDPKADTIPSRIGAPTRPGSGIVTAEIPPDLGLSPGLRYRPVRVLGSGGMGEVTLVIDEVIGREVALKRLKPNAPHDEAAREALAREAILQGRLEHPSIVPVYDVTVDSDGTLFFTMRRVQGRSLTHAMKELSRQRLLTALDQVCLAADFAHEKGVIHRDIKPENIMLGRHGEVYLLDWGIARLVSITAGPSAGTVGYMSPEQARGSSDLDARSDVYALGAILFELLTGEPLHPVAPISEMLVQIASGVDARPSARVPTADVPPELEAICVKATALDREQRYASARQLSEAIERYLEGDRDLAMRARTSREHGARAAELAKLGTVQGRSDALGEVGRALALDPSNADALATMVELLTTPPAELPPDAVAEMHAGERALDRVRSRTGALALSAWAVLTVGTVLALGMGNPVEASIGIGAVGLAALLSFVRLHRPRADGTIPTYHVLAIAGALFGFGLGFSPLLVTPTIGVLFIFACTLSISHDRRFVPLVAGSCALALPFILEWTHALSSSLIPHGGLLCVVPRMTKMSGTDNIAPALSSLALMILGCLYTLRFRTALTEMQRRNSVNAWQLRQLVPRSAA